MHFFDIFQADKELALDLLIFPIGVELGSDLQHGMPCRHSKTKAVISSALQRCLYVHFCMFLTHQELGGDPSCGPGRYRSVLAYIAVLVSHVSKGGRHGAPGL
jgi:hypothetical protein